MAAGEPATRQGEPTGSLASSSAAPSPFSMELPVFGCELDEAELFREKAPAFGITPVITPAPISDATIELAAGRRAISIGHKSRVTNEHLDALRAVGVRYISTRSIGFNHVDVAYAAQIGITVENVAYSPDSVADHTLMLMLMSVRHAKSVFRRTDVHDYRLHEVRGRELRDLTVGVVGTGRIGAAVIDRLQGFGCRVLAYDSQPKTSAEYVSLDDLLKRSDILTLHTPLDESTYHLLDRRAFDLMRPGAIVVNTGRGGLIDTEALLVALESGRLGGAALDVLEEEDGIFYTDHSGVAFESHALVRLHRLTNAIVTPHTAYFTDHALTDTVVNSLINCLRFEKELPHG